MILTKMHIRLTTFPAGGRLPLIRQAAPTLARLCSGEAHPHHFALPAGLLDGRHPSPPVPDRSSLPGVRYQHSQAEGKGKPEGAEGTGEPASSKDGHGSGREAEAELEGSHGPVAHVSQRLQAIMKHNKHFVDNKLYLQPQTSVPTTSATRCIVVTCMDARLTHLLEDATGLRPGQAKKIKTAGAIVSHPFGGIMRSVIVALYELGADEVFVIGHHDCGMNNINTQVSCAHSLASSQRERPAPLPPRPHVYFIHVSVQLVQATLQKVISKGHIPAETITTLQYAGIDLHKWLHGFDSVQDSVRSGVETITYHPLVPAEVPVHGLIIDPHTGKLDLVVDGSDTLKARALKRGIGKVRADAAEALGH